MVTNIFLSFYAVILMLLFVIGPMIKSVYKGDINKVPKGIVIPLGVIVVATPFVVLAHIFYFIWR